MAGQVDLDMDSGHVAVACGRHGQLRLLGFATPRRLAVLPDLPTIAETVPGDDGTA